MPDPGLLGRDDIVAALESLADALDPGTPIQLIAVGGSYMALRDLRAGTDDVDSVTRLDPPLRAAIREVARQRDLDLDWLNDHAAPWAPAGLKTDDCDLVLEHGPLRVLLPPADTIFLMKLAASRSGRVAWRMPPFPEQSSASIEIDAPPEVVWQFVADVTRMGEWSPECVRAEWEDGATGPAIGAHFHGYNKVGDYEWDASCIVTECEPGRAFAFEVPRGDENPTQWRFEFAPTGSGATLTESFHAPRINIEGSPANFEGRFEILAEGIKSTIANIKAAAESSAG